MDFATIAAIIVGGVLAGLADWYFGGVLFHDKYQAHPEIWRARETNMYAIAAAQVLALVSAFAFVVIAARLNATDYGSALTLGFYSWLLAPLPILLTNYAFIKLHPLVVASNAVGWLVKLLAMALVTATFL